MPTEFAPSMKMLHCVSPARNHSVAQGLAVPGIAQATRWELQLRAMEHTGQAQDQLRAPSNNKSPKWTPRSGQVPKEVAVHWLILKAESESFVIGPDPSAVDSQAIISQMKYSTSFDHEPPSERHQRPKFCNFSHTVGIRPLAGTKCPSRDPLYFMFQMH